MSGSVQYKVPAAIDEAFRHFIMDKYGTFKKGLIMEEASKAILHYISSQNTRTHAPRINLSSNSDIPPKILELKQRIFKFLKGTGKYEMDPQYVPLKYLREAIAAVKGTDPRTVTKYLNQLKEYRVIRECAAMEGSGFAGNGFEFIQELEEGEHLPNRLQSQ